MEKNNIIKLSVSAAVLVLAAILLINNLGKAGSQPDSRYFIDLATQELHVGDAGLVPPTMELGGAEWDYEGMGTAGSVVEAMIFGCGGTHDKVKFKSVQDIQDKGAKLGFVRRLTPIAAEVANTEEPTAEQIMQMGQAPYVHASPEGKTWYSELSPDGRKLASDFSGLDCTPEQVFVMLP
ncbi:hypothetical protein [Algisphaera agarilytica]|uniref:Uncharacterized protein n=1 Tax=Algisphaera agarilytica TaxID=1385975 RepID=A0A7X0H3A6_9BACT|nr:hypothetical protein [Algisphaera agarilytica]MBB6428486.1 hypothetical protein [Algisphaera agarilytica]